MLSPRQFFDLNLAFQQYLSPIGSAYITATESGGELASAITKITKTAKKNIEKTLSGLLGE